MTKNPSGNASSKMMGRKNRLLPASSNAAAAATVGTSLIVIALTTLSTVYRIHSRSRIRNT